MGSWAKGQTGWYFTCPEGFAFLTPWANPGFIHGVVYHRCGRVEEILRQDHHTPFRGTKYASSLERAQAVAESLLCPNVETRPTSWEKLDLPSV
jgi:hypothetical protein